MDPASKQAVISLAAITGGMALVSGAALLMIGRIAAANSALKLLGLPTLGAVFSALAGATAAIVASAAALAAAAKLESAAKADMDEFNAKANAKTGIPTMNAAGNYVVGGKELPASTTTVEAMAALKAYNATPGALVGNMRTETRGVANLRTPMPGSQYVSQWGGTPYQAPQLSEEALAGMESLNNKILKLQVNGLEYSEAILSQEADAMRQIAGMDSAKIAEYVKLQTAALTTAAQKDYKDSLYAVKHTTLETALYTEKNRIQAMVTAGGATQAQADALFKLSAAKITAEAKTSGTSTSKTDQWKPISIEGTNVTSLMKYIGSLQGAKVKPQEVNLNLKWDGKTIRIDNSGLNAETVRKMLESFRQEFTSSKYKSYANSN
jgi:hypothetical protein